jgi:hypothetical protein
VSDGATCASLLIRTTLKSPEPRVVAALRPDDVLVVEFRQDGSDAVVAKNQGGEVAGAIVSGSHAQMVACMRKGFQFVALVLGVDGGACDVEVRPGAT